MIPLSDEDEPLLREGFMSSSISAKRAILKDSVPCCADANQEPGRALAPRGEYDIEKGANGFGLCSCATQNRFTLSFDAFLQHVNEGRISLVRG